MRAAGRIARLGLAAAVVGLTLVLAACGATGPSSAALASGTPLTSGTTSPSPSGSQASPSLGGSAAPAAVPSGSGPVASVPIDPTLLDLLPASVAGLPVAVVPDPSGTDDLGLIRTVDRMVQAVVVDPTSDAFAYASVIVLKPGVFDDGFYRSWRDTFDEGACSQAGGVTGHAQASIGGRTTFIGRCDGGVLTYHVRLDDRDAIVSVSALGESRLGEQLVAGIRP